MLLSSVLLFSCLKDENITDQKYGMINLNANKIVGFKELTQANALPFENYDAIIKVPVHLSAENVASENIKVTVNMTKSASIISNYNTTNGKNVVQMPATLYSLQGTGLNVTIPQGSRDGYIEFKVNPSKLDPSTTYGIGLSIASVDNSGYVLSGNFKDILVTFGAKNKYDGVYTLTMKFEAPDRPTVKTGVDVAWGGPVWLVTTGGNSVNLFDDWGFGQNIQPFITNTGGYSGFGSTDPFFRIDPATNKVVEVKNSVINPSNGRAFQLDTSLDSYYDPATKKLVVNFIMTQPGFQPLKIRDTFTYVKARP